MQSFFVLWLWAAVLRATAIGTIDQLGTRKLGRLAAKLLHYKQYMRRNLDTENGQEQSSGAPTKAEEKETATVDASGNVQHPEPQRYTGVGPDPNSKLAVFSVLVKSSDDLNSNKFVAQALLLKCTAGSSTMPFHLMHAGLNNFEANLLKKFGWILHDVSHEVDFAKWLYRPVYTEEEAHRLKRPWLDRSEPSRVGIDHPVKAMPDGWATYFKYFAWRAPYEKVLLLDLDVCFTDASRPLEERIMAMPDKEFLASKDLTREYYGLDSHMVLLKPSNDTFASLIRRSKEGAYIPYTNGDQDVLEFEFHPDVVAQEQMSFYIPHLHSEEQISCTGGVLDTCGDVLRCAMCTPSPKA